MKELPTNFKFTEMENQILIESLLRLNINPYKFYPAFKQQIRNLISHLPILQRFIAFMDHQRSISTYDNPFVFIENCPVDPNLPEFGNENPLQDKYDKKKTFVAEGFLQIYAELAAEHPIAYLNVNDGDVFQDIFTKESLKYTQSQKAVGPIYFHKDFPNHFVRPDFVNILSLRSHMVNEICTIFVSNKDILENLSDSTKDILNRCDFYTPYDEITLSSANIGLGKAPNHAVLSGIHLRYFENRTIGLTPEAKAAIEELYHLSHYYKKYALMRQGDFVGISNNLSLHGREIKKIGDEMESYKRWSLKTVNVHSSAPHLKYFIPGTDYLVNG